MHQLAGLYGGGVTFLNARAFKYTSCSTVDVFVACSLLDVGIHVGMTFLTMTDFQNFVLI